MKDESLGDLRGVRRCGASHIPDSAYVTLLRRDREGGAKVGR